MRYVILLVLAVVTAGLSYWYRGKNWFVDSLGANLAAGFFGSLLLLVFIERSIEKKRDQERARLLVLGLRSMHGPLQAIVNVFATMIKASAARPFTSLPPTLSELFSAQNTSELDWLDLEAPGAHGQYPSWRLRIAGTVNSQCDQLSATLDRYLPYFDLQLIEAVETLMSDPFLQYARNLAKLPGAPFYGTMEMRLAFFERLLTVDILFGRFSSKPLSVPTTLIREDKLPKAGQDRLANLPAKPVWCGPGDLPKLQPEGL